MTRYTVAWQNSMLGELADVWLNSKNQSGVRRAADAIDQHLSVDPDKKGNLLAEDLWAITVHPLRFYYTISQNDRIVTIVGVVELAAD
jgi:hypothetical protein